MPIRSETLEAVEVEAVRAESQHGPLTGDLDHAFVILGEEFGEVARALLELNRGTAGKDAVRAELVQLASVALLMYENLE